MAIRDIEKEKKYLGEFGKKYGYMPSTAEQWKDFHLMVYGSDLPQEIANLDAKVISSSALPSSSIPTQTDPLSNYQGSNISDTAIQEATKQYEQYSQPKNFLNEVKKRLTQKFKPESANLGIDVYSASLGVLNPNQVMSGLAIKTNQIQDKAAIALQALSTAGELYSEQATNAYNKLNNLQTLRKEYEGSQKETESELRALALEIAKQGGDIPQELLDVLPQDEVEGYKALSKIYRETAKTRYKFIAGTENQPAGYFDETTGTFTPIDTTPKVDISTATADQIAEAIKQKESGGVAKVGATGEMKSMYQWLPATWNKISTDYAIANGLNQSIEPTAENEDAVAKWKIQQLLDKGWNAKEIAMIWNTSLGGSEQPLVKKGVNNGVPYDSESYANKVVNILGSIKTIVSQEPDEISLIGDAIINGLQPPTLTGLYGKSAAVKAYLSKQGFDLSKATQDWNATNRYLTTLNGAQQIRLRWAINFTAESLDLVDELNKQAEDELHRFGITKLASVQKSLAMQGVYGQEVKSLFTQLDNQISDLVGELATVYKGGNSSTDESLKLSAKQLSSNWDFQTLKDNVNLVRKNLQIRQNSINNTEVAGTSTGKMYSEDESAIESNLSDEEAYAEYLKMISQ